MLDTSHHHHHHHFIDTTSNNSSSMSTQQQQQYNNNNGNNSNNNNKNHIIMSNNTTPAIVLQPTNTTTLSNNNIQTMNQQQQQQQRRKNTAVTNSPSLAAPLQQQQQQHAPLYSFNSPLTQLALVFIAFAVLLVCVFLSLPSFQNEKEYRQILTLPRNLKQVKEMAHTLSAYTHDSYYRVILAIFCLYIFLQTFSVPGTIFLNVLCGALFGLPVAFAMTLMAGTAGASCAFLLSKLLGGGIIQRFFPDKLTLFKNQIDKQKNNLFYFMLFLRISPMLPNWFINICSPLLHVPFLYFFFATLCGIAPQTAISVNIGANIHDLVDDDSVGNPLINKSTILTLFGIAFMSLIPVLLKRGGQNSKKSNQDSQ